MNSRINANGKKPFLTLLPPKKKKPHTHTFILMHTLRYLIQVLTFLSKCNSSKCRVYPSDETLAFDTFDTHSSIQA